MINHSALIEAQASAIRDALKMERQVAAAYDAFDMEADSILTIAILEGQGTRTRRKIAAQLREFFRQLNPPPSGRETTDTTALPVAGPPCDPLRATPLSGRD